MSRRKPPVTTKAQRDDFIPVAATVRAEVERHMRASVQSQIDALNGLLKLELLFGRPPTPPETVDCAAMVDVPRQHGATQTVPPPASAWRSMASAPRNGSVFLAIVGKYSVFRIGYVCADGEHFRASDGCLYQLDEMHAWMPIPEWTGEVSE